MAESEHLLYDDDVIVCYQGESNEGHIICKPKADIKSAEEMPEEVFELMSYCASLASTALFEFFGAQGSNIILQDYGKGVEVHILSRKQDDGMNFNWERMQLQPADMDPIMKKIKDKCDFIGVAQVASKLVDFDKVEDSDYNIRRLP